MTNEVRHVRETRALDAGEGEAVWFLSNRVTVKATAASTGGAYGLIEALLPPGFSPPLHVHHREDESFWVLEGRFTVVCDGRTIAAGPGSYVFVPRDAPHTFVVEGDAPGRLLTLLTPGGSEAFFVAAGRPAAGDGLPPAGPIDLAALARVAPQFGLEIIGPPLEAGRGERS
jgi:mannose-6-phosphate isomerase-like protein (cupin superfamily)